MSDSAKMKTRICEKISERTVGYTIPTKKLSDLNTLDACKEYKKIGLITGSCSLYEILKDDKDGKKIKKKLRKNLSLYI